MKKHINRWILLTVFLYLILCLFTACTESSQNEKQARTQGYYATAFVGNSFYAAGTGGRLDRIETDKQIYNIEMPTTEDLVSIWADESSIFVGGSKGTLFYSADGVEFSSIDTGVSECIFGITVFKGSYYACSEKGRLIQSQDGLNWKSVQMDTKYDLIAIASNENYIMAITAESDIFLSQDGDNWELDNFNESYANEYVPYVFTGLKNMGASFFIYGQEKNNPGSPFTMFSESGSVWTFKPFHEINGAESGEYLPLTIRGIGHNLDQVLAVCNQGRLLTITECSTCHQITELGENDLNTMAYGDGRLLIAGADFIFDVVDDTLFRQYNISPEQANENFKTGRAIIIDVRTSEEYEERHITGSLNIPVDEIEARLTEVAPDQQAQIIFYCKAGTRSAAALETALELGYSYVYNLGGIDKWPYDTQSGSST